MLLHELQQHLSVLLWVIAIGSTMVCILHEVGFQGDIVCLRLCHNMVSVCDGNSAIFHAVYQQDRGIAFLY